MSHFVLDNSVAMRWLTPSNKKADQAYADKILRGFVDHRAVVPTLWHIEAISVLLSCEKHDEITDNDTARFLGFIKGLDIQTDTYTSSHAFNRTTDIARQFNLSGYDATYLELALREGLPLATLDKDLAKAAKKAGASLHLKG